MRLAYIHLCYVMAMAMLCYAYLIDSDIQTDDDNNNNNEKEEQNACERILNGSVEFQLDAVSYRSDVIENLFVCTCVSYSHWAIIISINLCFVFLGWKIFRRCCAGQFRVEIKSRYRVLCIQYQ